MQRTLIHAVLCSVAFGGALFFQPSPAQAHFKLQKPADWLQTDADGDPLGGASATQKENPCGAGTASKIITKVHVSSSLHVKLTETVPHGGHYRIALLPKHNLVNADIPEPKVTPASGACTSAVVQNPVVAPVIADGLFEHTQLQAKAGKVWETDVTMPADTGDYTLQIIEFMTPHSPSCFYHHCAQLQLVPESEDIPDPNADDDAGANSSSSGTSGTTSSSSGSSGASSGSNGSVTTRPSSSGSTPAGSDDSGCNTSSNATATPSLIVVSAFGLIALSLVRRRKSSW